VRAFFCAEKIEQNKMTRCSAGEAGGAALLARPSSESFKASMPMELREQRE